MAFEAKKVQQIVPDVYEFGKRLTASQHTFGLKAKAVADLLRDLAAKFEHDPEVTTMINDDPILQAFSVSREVFVDDFALTTVKVVFHEKREPGD